MVKPVMYYERLEFASGRTVQLKPSGVIAFVGPNNVGKSTALYELRNQVLEGRLEFNGHRNRVFAETSFGKADESDFLPWLRKFESYFEPRPGQDPTTKLYRNWTAGVEVSEAVVLNEFRDDTLARFREFLVNEGKHAPFHGEVPDFYNESRGNRQFEDLFGKPEVEASLDRLSREAFGEGVSLMRRGRYSNLHFGALPEFGVSLTKEDQKILSSTPKLTDQGQGVQSLMALATSLEMGEEPFVFLDEPEAHLHPPQARLAGLHIAARAERSQVFIATHSIELLRGLLQNDVEVTIIRLSRDKGSPEAAVLGGQDLMAAWKDPLVRYSGALNGLMHRGVIICESEADCLYYEATLDYLREREGIKSPHDLLFVHAGGKAAVKKLVPSLRGLAVPLCVLVDFDMLRTRKELNSLFSLLGGDPTSITADLQVIDNHLLKGKGKKISEVKMLLQKHLDGLDNNETYSKSHLDSIKALLKVGTTGWDFAKDHGLSALKGSPNVKAKVVLTKLRERGLTVCPFGQLESFHRDAPAGHGPEWVLQVIDSGLFKSIGSDEAKFLMSLPDRCVSA